MPRQSAFVLLVILSVACGEDDFGVDASSDGGCSEDDLCPVGWSVVSDGNNPYCPFNSSEESCVQRTGCGMEYKCAPDGCGGPSCDDNEVQISLPTGPRPDSPHGPVTSRSACGRSIECAACTGPAECGEGQVVVLSPATTSRNLACTDEGPRFYECQDEAECFSCFDPSLISGPPCTDEEGAEECTAHMCGSDSFGCRPSLACDDVTCDDQTSEVLEVALGECEEQPERCVSVACGAGEQVRCTTLCRTGARVVSGAGECSIDEYCEAVTHLGEEVWCAGGAIDPDCGMSPMCDSGFSPAVASEPCDMPDSCYYAALCGRAIRCEST